MNRFDVIIYGATASGVIAAIAASKRGVRVALLEPSNHVGGMVTGGLGHTDLGREDALIGGYARGFFLALGRHYEKEAPVYDFEPSAAQRVLDALLAQTDVVLMRETEIVSVHKEEEAIVSAVSADGQEYHAPYWIDASYEGDLMQLAGVSYVVGREGQAAYGESLAGRQDLLPGQHQFLVPVPSRGESGQLPPYVEPQERLAPTGAGDGKFQAYCYRLCLTDREENRLPIPRPERYARERFELVSRYLEALGPGACLWHFLGIFRVANDKTDVNSNGAVSTDLLGGSWEYPDASPARRKEIAQEHLDWAHGLIWFLQHDPAVPAALRTEALRWGLCRDEFPETGHWPPQLYVREGRRMLGESIVTQHDLMAERSKHDSIGMAGYNIDIREVQWVSRLNYHYPNATEEVFMEGYVTVPVEPWEIPYRALLPRYAQCRNLLVSVCASMSTVAFASFRMEPQYMIAGHAAGTAAALAHGLGCGYHHLPLGTLQNALREEGQVLTLADCGASPQ